MTPSQVQAARKAFEAPFSDRMERYATGGYVNELINEQWIGYRSAWEQVQKIVDDREAEIALLGTELQRQAASLTAERDRYRDTLLSRHGGECLALLDELDEARERIAALTRELAACAEKDAEIARLRKRLREQGRETREDANASAAEAVWKERQGDEYGSY